MAWEHARDMTFRASDLASRDLVRTGSAIAMQLAHCLNSISQSPDCLALNTVANPATTAPEWHAKRRFVTSGLIRCYIYCPAF